MSTKKPQSKHLQMVKYLPWVQLQKNEFPTLKQILKSRKKSKAMLGIPTKDVIRKSFKGK